ncbi:MAG: homoserine dehydrogenase [Alphaproteobacteria bacterium]|nr:homoserine dehydrogenase [Alphaproteobacteria bacterium]
MSEPLKLGVAGLGTVGAGLLQLIETHRDRLSAILPRPLQVAAVSARSRTKDRGVSLAGVRWFDDPVALAADPGIDVFVELIGGENGPAKAAIEAALAAGKHVVTANKALLAKHGVALARLAEENAVALNFEAAVAGGIPVIKTMREAFIPNKVSRVYGILNGTCNYILTVMEEDGRSFADVLKEAQDMGYAEADPTFDVGGFDAGHKLALMTSLAFGTEVAADQIHVEGIDTITEADIEAARDLGYRIKLLGVAIETPSGIEARVHPAMVPMHSAIAEVSGVTNCVALEGDFTGPLLLVGAGAGGRPTAAAVASDIVDVARGIVLPPFITPSDRLSPHRRARIDEHCGAYYMRMSVRDEPGAMASIAKCMGDEGVSLESVVQRREMKGLPGSGKPTLTGGPATVIMITHETTEDAIRRAVASIEANDKVAARPQVIRIEKL